jgi:uncharacterized RDD family membrane protein YckC
MYAGFWRRSFAFIIDCIFSIIVFFMIPGLIATRLFVRDVETVDKNIIITIYLTIFLLSVIMFWLYCSIMESSSKQATLGKKALNITVTDLEGKRVSFGRATIRFWSKYFSSAILFIGFIMIGFTAKKQALHDIIAKTLVLVKN